MVSAIDAFAGVGGVAGAAGGQRGEYGAATVCQDVIATAVADDVKASKPL